MVNVLLAPRISVLAAVLLTSTAAGAEDARCSALFEQASSELAAEQYAKMLRTADDRMRLCPDAESAFLLGLAQANMVDSLTVADPAEREQMRLSALRHLRIAAAGGNLKSIWEFTVHDWIVHLQSLGPSAAMAIAPDEIEQDAAAAAEDLSDPSYVPAAPPPQAQPVFPWGPVVTGTLGVAALTTGIVLGIDAADSREEARAAANRLRLAADDLEPRELESAVRRTHALNDDANSKATWSTVFLVSGAVATVGAVVWYLALPPKGKWRWAALPTGIQATARF
jgi:hypothetical protein